MATTGLQAGRYLGSLGFRHHIVILRGAVIHMNVVSLYVMSIVVGEKENKARDNLFKKRNYTCQSILQSCI